MIRGDCGSCQFWEMVQDRSEEGCQNEGLCRRHPPVAVPSATAHAADYSEEEQGLLAVWPRTFAESDWCGEWVEKDRPGIITQHGKEAWLRLRNERLSKRIEELEKAKEGEPHADAD